MAAASRRSAGLAVLFDRRPAWLPVAAVATLPFRVPIASGGSTANLLVPLYLVVGRGRAGLRRPAAAPRPRGDEPAAPGRWLEWALAATWCSTPCRRPTRRTSAMRWRTSSSSTCPSRCSSRWWRACNGRPAWPRVCLGVLAGLAVVLVGVGFVEYATRHLFLNPKVIASNQLEDYFRVNSLFFDPNIYGRFLAS